MRSTSRSWCPPVVTSSDGSGNIPLECRAWSGIDPVRARRLTPAHRAHIPAFIDKWIEVGRSTAPIDHDRAERALGQLYMSAGLIAPQVVGAPGPMTAILSAIVYTTIRAKGQESKADSDSALAEITGQITQSSLAVTAAPSVHRAMHLSVERTVVTALACSCRIWSGFD